MISADVVAQVMSVSRVTQVSKMTVGSFMNADNSGGCCCRRQNDFTAILEDIAARSPEGIDANSLFFPGIQDSSASRQPSSDMIGLFAGLISGDGQNEFEQDPFEFIQSLSMQQRTTYQSFDYMTNTSSANGKIDFAEAKALFQRIASTFLNNGGEFGSESQLMFPPAHAPQEVREAWDRASSDAVEVDKILVSGMFIGMAINDDMPRDRGEQSTSLPAGVEELDQYWQQVETLLALIDQALERSPEREADIDGAKGLLVRFLDELNEVSET
jgi:hypothetical protein